MKLSKSDLLLYAVTDRSWVKEKTLYEQVEEALQGGVTMIQLREKGMNYCDFKNEAQKIKKLCRAYKVPFLINDNVKLAKEIDADGVHIGQDDMKLTEARAFLGNEKIIGVSARTIKEAVEAEENGADYLGVGAVFPTSTKTDAIEVSHDTLKAISSSVKIPIVAIGGITYKNMEELKGTGICGLALVSAIFAQKDIKTSAQALYSKAKEIFNDQSSNF